AAPYQVENRVIGRVIGIGGADWSTWGVSQRGFSNSLNLQYRSNSIEMTGYNYDRLYRYAQDLCDLLRRNPRAVDVVIVTPGHENQEDEYYVRYNWERLKLLGITPGQIHSAVNDLLLTWDFGRYDPLNTNIRIRSTRRDTHDVWQLFNSYVKVGDRDIRLSEVMDIRQREAKNVIPRRNQEYVLRVEFNILGSYIYTSNYIKEVTEKMETLLPVGFRCVRPQWSDRPTASEQYWLIGLCLLITYWLMTILFESLWRPLAMLLALMPFTLTSVFLTFHFAGIPFGTGGLAALVLLCGLVINAAIYIMYQYDLIRKTGAVSPCRAYLQAYNHKIIPVILTILSTVFSLIPFLVDGPENRFWYTFAITVIVGLTASFAALV
ncbi:MAG: efflux RND transporter permease subunit, partial [Bacteroidaceae bacterium]|nr:efflux RND transporter permease subunit [Bacteroidaceae bacterium]